VLTRTGFRDAVIHIRDEISEYLHTAYWIQAARGLVIGFLVYVGAPLVAQFFGEPKVTPIVKVLALVQVLRGFRSIGVVMLRRAVNFRDESLFRATGIVTEFLVTVGLAILLRDVWALVWGRIAKEGVLLLVSFRIHPYRPRLHLDGKKAMEMFQYGIWLLGAGIVSYVALNADNVVAGRWIGAGALGVYQMGYAIANLPTNEISKQVGRVFQSGFAELQRNELKLQACLRKALLLLFAVMLPSVVGIALTGHIAVPFVLGQKWNEIIPILPILAFGSLFRGISTLFGTFHKATGNTDYLFYSECFRSFILCVGLSICIVYSYGLVSISWSFFSSALGSSVLYVYLTKDYLSPIKILAQTIPTITSVVVMSASLYPVVMSKIHVPDLVYFGGVVVAGVTIYTVVHVITERLVSFRAFYWSYKKIKSVA